MIRRARTFLAAALSAVALGAAALPASAALAPNPPAGETHVGVDWVHGPTPQTAAQRQIAHDSVGTMQNVHVGAFGVGTGQWAQTGDVDFDGPGYDWTELDRRVAMMQSVKRDNGGLMLTLYAPPQWMMGVAPGDWSQAYYDARVLPQYMQAWVDYTVFIAKRYPAVKNFQVWNEMKGLWNPAENRWDSEYYIDMYNRIWTAIKAVRPAVKIGGPYVVMDWRSGPAGSQGGRPADPGIPGTPGPLVSAGNDGYVDGRALRVHGEFKAGAIGRDFVAFDMGPGVDGSLEYDPNTTDRWALSIKWLRQLYGTGPYVVSEAYWGGTNARLNTMLNGLASTNATVVALMWHENWGVSDLLWQGDTPSATATTLKQWTTTYNP